MHTELSTKVFYTPIPENHGRIWFTAAFFGKITELIYLCIQLPLTCVFQALHIVREKHNIKPILRSTRTIQKVAQQITHCSRGILTPQTANNKIFKHLEGIRKQKEKAIQQAQKEIKKLISSIPAPSYRSITGQSTILVKQSSLLFTYREKVKNLSKTLNQEEEIFDLWNRDFLFQIKKIKESIPKSIPLTRKEKKNIYKEEAQFLTKSQLTKFVELVLSEKEQFPGDKNQFVTMVDPYLQSFQDHQEKFVAAVVDSEHPEATFKEKEQDLTNTLESIFLKTKKRLSEVQADHTASKKEQEPTSPEAQSLKKDPLETTPIPTSPKSSPHSTPVSPVQQEDLPVSPEAQSLKKEPIEKTPTPISPKSSPHSTPVSPVQQEDLPVSRELQSLKKAPIETTSPSISTETPPPTVTALNEHFIKTTVENTWNKLNDLLSDAIEAASSEEDLQIIERMKEKAASLAEKFLIELEEISQKYLTKPITEESIKEFEQDIQYYLIQNKPKALRCNDKTFWTDKILWPIRFAHWKLSELA